MEVKTKGDGFWRPYIFRCTSATAKSLGLVDGQITEDGLLVEIMEKIPEIREESE